MLRIRILGPRVTYVFLVLVTETAISQSLEIPEKERRSLLFNRKFYANVSVCHYVLHLRMHKHRQIQHKDIGPLTKCTDAWIDL